MPPFWRNWRRISFRFSPMLYSMMFFMIEDIFKYSKLSCRSWLGDDYLWFCFYICILCYIFHGRTNYSLVIICLPFWEAEACIYWKMERYIVGGWSFIFFVLHAQSWNIVFYANLLQQTLSCELLWKKVQSHRLADWSYCWKQTELTPSCRDIFGEGDGRQDEYRIVVFIGTGFIVRCRLKAGCVLAPFVSLGSSKACSYKDLSLRFHRDCHSF